MTTSELVHLLSDGNYHSGERLGEQLGVSRTAVWKQLNKLEALGIPVEVVRGRGYRLASPIELLDGSRIVSALTKKPRRHLARLFVEESVSSTNSFLRERFVQGAGHAEVCLAEVQSAGRGRRGRQWLSAWGQGLTLSLGWRFDGGASALKGLSLAIGVVIAQVLERHGLLIALKWPNDVLMTFTSGEKRKLAGVLVELNGDALGACEVVVGIGLNIMLPASLRDQIDQPVAAVAEQLLVASRNDLAADLIEALLNLMASYEQDGFAAWQQDWNQRNAYSARAIEVTQGVQCYIATDEGVDDEGNLCVRRGNKMLRLSGGEISLRASP
ncbi:biotin--[acetyl-CoA-carboxylase] ligase [Halomonas sp. M20]|uniref:biotin--[acetyl-CoA-carboxylase] ligase n=1 Tax=Halomonas sp. M20 TaxID=2763264 RepID=UPI001D0B82A1|nr:biotin--[acetyl-CoA-carboxylase] ligase [Halomonas sp. M20]